MDTIAHLTAGYSITRVCIALENDPEIERNKRKWLKLGMFFSQVPDLDGFCDMFSHEGRVKQLTKGSNHHGSWTHLPFLYAVIIGSGALIIPQFKNKNLTFAFKLFAFNIVAHMIMDSLGMGEGLRWFYPFKKEQVGVNLTRKIGPQDWREFYLNKRVIFELLIYFLAAMEMFWEKRNR